MSTSPRPGPPARRRQGRRAAPREGGGPDLREAILAATTGLLTEHDFGDLAVSDILTAAGVSRGTFYFYFDSKHDVLAELVRRAVAQGHAAAAPWLANPADPAGRAARRDHRRSRAVAVQRTGPARHRRELACRSAPHSAVARADADFHRRDHRPAQRRSARPALLSGQDIPALASALTWLGERLYYLAATNTPPFDDQDTLVSTLVSIWAAVLYRQ